MIIIIQVFADIFDPVIHERHGSQIIDHNVNASNEYRMRIQFAKTCLCEQPLADKIRKILVVCDCCVLHCSSKADNLMSDMCALEGASVDLVCLHHALVQSAERLKRCL